MGGPTHAPSPLCRSCFRFAQTWIELADSVADIKDVVIAR